MPIIGNGWEIHIQRAATQTLGEKMRTIGHYRVYHNGMPTNLFGMTAESKGPGTNTVQDKRRIVQGRYPLWTQDGTDYKTFGYKSDAMYPRPGLELKDTGLRKEILIHPGHHFLASIGCINLCTNLPTPTEPISFASSRKRVISVINDVLAFMGELAPQLNGRRIPDAWAVIDGEP